MCCDCHLRAEFLVFGCRYESKVLSALEHAKDWVFLDLKLRNWKWVNFSVCVRDSTRLASIRTLIEARHGRITNFALYRASLLPSQENQLITDYNETLADIGVLGGAKEDRRTAVRRLGILLSCPLSCSSTRSSGMRPATALMRVLLRV